jgi:uncharacterized protein YjbJ (UPF0337 family)
MNKDQIKGKTTGAVGKAQEKLGEMTGSTKQQAKGFAKQVKGILQEGIGDAKNIADNARKQKPR